MEKLFSLSCQKFFSVDFFVYTRVNFIFQKNLKLSQNAKKLKFVYILPQFDCEKIRILISCRFQLKLSIQNFLGHPVQKVNVSKNQKIKSSPRKKLFCVICTLDCTFRHHGSAVGI